MKGETKEKIKKVIYVFLCIISLGLLCSFPFLSKSCSSQDVIKNVDKSFSKLSGEGYLVENPSNALTIFNNRRNFEDHLSPLSEINSFLNNQRPIINNDYDLFGLGIDNYFRFTYKPEFQNKISGLIGTCYSLDFYIKYGNNIGIYSIGYYDIYTDTDNSGEYFSFDALTYDTFLSYGLSVDFY